MITGYIPRVHLNLILAYLFREEVNKDEPGLFYWIYMFFFWTQCISTVVLAVLIAAKRNEDGPIFVVKVRPAFKHIPIKIGMWTVHLNSTFKYALDLHLIFFPVTCYCWSIIYLAWGYSVIYLVNMLELLM